MAIYDKIAKYRAKLLPSLTVAAENNGGSEVDYLYYGISFSGIEQQILRLQISMTS